MTDLSKFTDPEDVRSYVASPFVLDGYRHATNGHILVRVPAPDEVDTEGLLVAESIRKMFATAHAEFVPLPQVTAYAPCKDCGGKGFLERGRCPDCHGDGEFMHGEYYYDCQNCDGTGEAEAGCRTCAGAGEPFTSVQIGDAKFQAKYLRLIAGLPNVRICTGGPTEMAAFVFDGGEGRLMPCRE